jgi:hypothetical protein
VRYVPAGEDSPAKFTQAFFKARIGMAPPIFAAQRFGRQREVLAAMLHVKWRRLQSSNSGSGAKDFTQPV